MLKIAVTYDIDNSLLSPPNSVTLTFEYPYSTMTPTGVACEAVASMLMDPDKTWIDLVAALEALGMVRMGIDTLAGVHYWRMKDDASANPHDSFGREARKTTVRVRVSGIPGGGPPFIEKISGD